jgi:hypothetical protein
MPYWQFKSNYFSKKTPKYQFIKLEPTRKSEVKKDAVNQQFDLWVKPLIST